MRDPRLCSVRPGEPWGRGRGDYRGRRIKGVWGPGKALEQCPHWGGGW